MSDEKPSEFPHYREILPHHLERLRDSAHVAKITSPKFKQWFGDWEGGSDHSKVIHPLTAYPAETMQIDGTNIPVSQDRQDLVRGSPGAPRPVFHGTSLGGYDRYSAQFMNPKNLMGPGFYHTEDPELANTYTRAVNAVAGSVGRPQVQMGYMDLRNPFDADHGLRLQLARANDSMRPMIDPQLPTWRKIALWFAALRDKEFVSQAGRFRIPFGVPGVPLPPAFSPREDHPQETFGEMAAKFNAKAGKAPGDPYGKQAAHEHLQRLGFDGITHTGGIYVTPMGQAATNGRIHRVWIGFRPNQFKHVDNTGEFNPQDDRFHYGHDGLGISELVQRMRELGLSHGGRELAARLVEFLTRNPYLRASVSMADLALVHAWGAGMVRYGDGFDFDAWISDYPELKAKLKAPKAPTSEPAKLPELKAELKAPTPEQPAKLPELKAPTSKPAPQPPPGHSHIHTPEFKAWFGDWTTRKPGEHSHVTHPETGPIEVYHGTGGDFDSFDLNKVSNFQAVGRGFYFAEHPEIANHYATRRGNGRVVKAYLNIRQPFDFDSELTREDVERLQAAVANPQFADAADAVNHLKIRHDRGVPISKHEAWSILDSSWVSDVNGILQHAGWDGLKHRSGDVTGLPRRREHEHEDDYGAVYVAFHPNQIKSTNNRGTYDPSDHRIDYSLEDVEAAPTHGDLLDDADLAELRQGSPSSHHLGLDEHEKPSLLLRRLEFGESPAPGLYITTYKPVGNRWHLFHSTPHGEPGDFDFTRFDAAGQELFPGYDRSRWADMEMFHGNLNGRELHDAELRRHENWTRDAADAWNRRQPDWRPNEVTPEDYYAYAKDVEAEPATPPDIHPIFKVKVHKSNATDDRFLIDTKAKGGKWLYKPNPHLPGLVGGQDRYELNAGLHYGGHGAALNHYTRFSRPINAYLRGPDNWDYKRAKASPEFYERLRTDIEGAFRRQPAFESPVELHRSLYFNAFNLSHLQDEFMRKLFLAHDKGDLVQWPGYTSASTSAKPYYAGKEPDIKMHILTRHGIDVRPFSYYPDEAEVLLNHNSNFRVMGYNGPGGDGGKDKYHHFYLQQWHDPEKIHYEAAAPMSQPIILDELSQLPFQYPLEYMIERLGKQSDRKEEAQDILDTLDEYPGLASAEQIALLRSWASQ